MPNDFVYLNKWNYLSLSVVNGRMEHKHRNPLFNDTPTNLTYYRGDRAILQCSVKNLGTKQVHVAFSFFKLVCFNVSSKALERPHW